MDAPLWKVGELARLAGLSVRTLHHYDDIGLLAPSRRSKAGYRLYAPGDVVRLQQITSLRQLGFSLEEIRHLLHRSDISPLRVIQLHLSRLTERIAREQRLRERLTVLATRFEAAEEVSVADVLNTIEEMTMVENIESYYTPEQLAALRERSQRVGPERLRQVEAEWPKLIADVREEMERGTDPMSDRVQGLAQRWQALIDEFTGGDPGIERSLQSIYEKEPAVRDRSGADPELFAYIGRALRARRSE